MSEPYGIGRSPSERTFHFPSFGKPGASFVGSRSQPSAIIATGIGPLILSTIIIGVGTWLKGQGGGH